MVDYFRIYIFLQETCIYSHWILFISPPPEIKASKGTCKHVGQKTGLESRLPTSNSDLARVSSEMSDRSSWFFHWGQLTLTSQGLRIAQTETWTTNHTSFDTSWLVDSQIMQLSQGTPQRPVFRRLLPSWPCLPVLPTSLGLELLRCPAISRCERMEPPILTTKDARGDSPSIGEAWVNRKRGLRDWREDSVVRQGALEGFWETICFLFWSPTS